jgi:hypothetical protein
VGDRLGLTIDLEKGKFRAHIEKLHAISKQASALLGRAGCNALWLPAKQVASFVVKSRFLYFAIAPARFILRELHSVLVKR